MGGSSSKSESESGSEFTQDVWGPQGEALQQLYNQVGSLFGSTLGGMEALTPEAISWMNQIQQQTYDPWQQQMAGGAYADMDLQNQLMQSLQQSMGQPSQTSQMYAQIMGGEGNTYADAMRDQYIQDATRAQENMLANLDARAAASGMSGGSRHGIATAQGMEDINQNLQANMANLGYETFDQDLQNKLNIAAMADQNQLAQQQMLSDMIGQQQAAMQGGLGYGSAMQQLGLGAFSPYMMPWQAAGMYGNIIGMPTVLGSGSSSGSSDSKSAGVSF